MRKTRRQSTREILQTDAQISTGRTISLKKLQAAHHQHPFCWHSFILEVLATPCALLQVNFRFEKQKMHAKGGQT